MKNVTMNDIYQFAYQMCDQKAAHGCTCKRSNTTPCDIMKRHAAFAIQHGATLKPERDIERERAYACYVAWCEKLNTKPEPYHDFVPPVVYVDGWKAIAAAALNFKPEE